MVRPSSGFSSTPRPSQVTPPGPLLDLAVGIRLGQDQAPPMQLKMKTKRTIKWVFKGLQSSDFPHDNDSHFGGRGIKYPISLTVSVPQWQFYGHERAAGVRPAHGCAHPACHPQRTESGPSGIGRPRCSWMLRPRQRGRATRRWSSTCSSSASPSSTSSTSSHPAYSSPLSPSSSTSFLPRVPGAFGGGGGALPWARGDSWQGKEWHHDPGLGQGAPCGAGGVPHSRETETCSESLVVTPSGWPEVYRGHQRAPGPDRFPLPRG